MTIEQIKTELKTKLKQSRYEHSLSVADTAKELATQCGADADKAYLAGLLHDCAKNYSSDEMFELIDKYSIDLDPVAQKSFGLLHAFVGAYEARAMCGIDEEIFDAIYYHTVGKADMPLLTKIIYLADAIEPMRDFPGVEHLRDVAKCDIDRAVLEYTDMTIKFVLNQGNLLHPSAVETRNFYLEKTK